MGDLDLEAEPRDVPLDLVHDPDPELGEETARRMDR